METELPPQESEGKASGSSVFLASRPLYMKHVYVYQPPPLRPCQSQLLPLAHCTLCFLSFSLDLFQDLSQLQETWLTEGEICPFFLFIFHFVLVMMTSKHRNLKTTLFLRV